jgi:hypothetical protein
MHNLEVFGSYWITHKAKHTTPTQEKKEQPGQNDSSLLYPEQGAASAVQAEVITPHIQTSSTKDL